AGRDAGGGPVTRQVSRVDGFANSRPVLALWFGFSAVCAIALAAVLLLVSRDELRLDLRHDSTRARVLSTYSQSRGPGGAVVRFTAGRRTVDAHVGLSWFGGTPRAGQTITVEYDPGNPTRARRAGTHDLIALGVPGLVVGGIALTGWRRWRGSTRPRPKKR
ncbi:MAG TPA: DUF3592 domain-containing protein, partial [Mycobacteriales bacterium]|nr:DUF3592 domain-containing protein [Mycobacteriales bacterium]